MKSSHEVQLLRKVLAQLDTPAAPKGRACGLVVNLLLWVIAFGIFLVYFRYGGSVHWTALLSGGACLALGHLTSYHAYKRMYARQWPIIAPYFDRAKIEEYLHGVGA